MTDWPVYIIRFLYAQRSYNSPWCTLTLLALSNNSISYGGAPAYTETHNIFIVTILALRRIIKRVAAYVSDGNSIILVTILVY